MEGKNVEFFVILCGDILLEVLKFINFDYGYGRYKLIKLQRIGRRFYRIIETYFCTKPFLDFPLQLRPLYF